MSAPASAAACVAYAVAGLVALWAAQKLWDATARYRRWPERRDTRGHNIDPWKGVGV